MGSKKSVGGAHAALRDEERKQLLNDLKRLRRDKLLNFVRSRKLSGSAKETKSGLAERIMSALQAGTVRLDAVVAFLDATAEWDKQHVILLGPPATVAELDPKKWRNEEWLRERLAEHTLDSLLSKRKALVLPEKMKLASIQLDPAHGLRVIAVQRHQGYERDPNEDDESTRVSDGADVELRAFVKVITRGLVIFEWNLRTNVAMLRIRQLPGGLTYEKVAETFMALVREWLPVAHFPRISLGQAILQLRELAKDEDEGIRAHAVDIAGVDGRHVIGKSQHAQQRLEGNEHLDDALDGMAEDGSGYAGKFFFEAENDNAVDEDNEDDEDDDDDDDVKHRRRNNDAHVVLLGSKKNRVNFMTPQPEAVIRAVLLRIRAVC